MDSNDNTDSKWWETISKPEELRDHIEDWSLAGDAAVALLINSISTKLVSFTDDVTKKLDNLVGDVAKLEAEVANTSNSFTLLSHTQFIENRTYLDDERISAQDSQQQNLSASLSCSTVERTPTETFKSAVKSGLAALGASYDQHEVQDSEDEEESPTAGTSLYVLHNPYTARPLPHVLMTEAFMADPRVGLAVSSDEHTPEDSAAADISSTSEDEDIGDSNIFNKTFQATSSKPQQDEGDSDSDWSDNISSSLSRPPLAGVRTDATPAPSMKELSPPLTATPSQPSLLPPQNSNPALLNSDSDEEFFKPVSLKNNNLFGKDRRAGPGAGGIAAEISGRFAAQNKNTSVAAAPQTRGVVSSSDSDGELFKPPPIPSVANVRAMPSTPQQTEPSGTSSSVPPAVKSKVAPQTTHPSDTQDRSALAGRGLFSSDTDSDDGLFGRKPPPIDRVSSDVRSTQNTFPSPLHNQQRNATISASDTNVIQPQGGPKVPVGGINIFSTAITAAIRRSALSSSDEEKSDMDPPEVPPTATITPKQPSLFSDDNNETNIFKGGSANSRPQSNPPQETPPATVQQRRAANVRVTSLFDDDDDDFISETSKVNIPKAHNTLNETAPKSADQQSSLRHKEIKSKISQQLNSTTANNISNPTGGLFSSDDDELFGSRANKSISNKQEHQINKQATISQMNDNKNSAAALTKDLRSETNNLSPTTENILPKQSNSSSNQKPKPVTPPNPTASIFSDSDDDDLFNNKPAVSVTPNVKTIPPQTLSKPTTTDNTVIPTSSTSRPAHNSGSATGGLFSSSSEEALFTPSLVTAPRENKKTSITNATLPCKPPLPPTTSVQFTKTAKESILQSQTHPFVNDTVTNLNSSYNLSTDSSSKTATPDHSNDKLIAQQVIASVSSPSQYVSSSKPTANTSTMKKRPVVPLIEPPANSTFARNTNNLFDGSSEDEDFITSPPPTLDASESLFAMHSSDEDFPSIKNAIDYPEHKPFSVPNVTVSAASNTSISFKVNIGEASGNSVSSPIMTITKSDISSNTVVTVDKGGPGSSINAIIDNSAFSDHAVKASQSLSNKLVNKINSAAVPSNDDKSKPYKTLAANIFDSDDEDLFTEPISSISVKVATDAPEEVIEDDIFESMSGDEMFSNKLVEEKQASTMPQNINDKDDSAKDDVDGSCISKDEKKTNDSEDDQAVKKKTSIKPPVGGVALFGGSELLSKVNKRRINLDNCEIDVKQTPEERVKPNEKVLPRPSDNRPIVTMKPSDNKPVVSMKPSDNKPVVSMKSSDNKPVVSMKPSDNKPVVSMKPSDNKPVVSMKPSDNKPVVSMKPSDNKSVVSEDTQSPCDSQPPSTALKKKPVGGIALFGGAELAAKLKKRQVQTDDSDGDESSSPTPVASPEKNIRSPVLNFLGAQGYRPPTRSSGSVVTTEAAFNFEADPESTNVLASVQKYRPRGSKKRRPPTRHSLKRQHSLSTSVTDGSQRVNEGDRRAESWPSTGIKSQDSKATDAVIDNNHDSGLGSLNSENNSPQNKDVAKKASTGQGMMPFSSSEDDDSLFGSVPSKTVLTNSSMLSPSMPPPSSSHVPSATSRSALSSKPANLFESESESDTDFIFGSSITKGKSDDVSTSASRPIFSDSDGDDLFTGATLSHPTTKNTSPLVSSSNNTNSAPSREQDFVDPLSSTLK